MRLGQHLVHAGLVPSKHYETHVFRVGRILNLLYTCSKRLHVKVIVAPGHDDLGPNCIPWVAGAERGRWSSAEHSALTSGTAAARFI